MKPEGPFVAARALAQHSPVLLRRASPSRRPGADALAATLGARLAAGLGKALAPFLAGALPEVTCGEARIGPCDPPGEGTVGFAFADRTITASIDAAVVAALVERCFGGAGPGAPATRLTPAANLLARRIAARLGEALGGGLGRDPLEASEGAQTIPGRTAQFELSVAEAGREHWQIRFALSCDLLDAIGDPAAPRSSAPRSGDPAALPWSAIALPLRAVLVDMAVPLGTVATLEPGQVIPVSVARRVPLKVGGRVVGHGDVGVFDDCAALRLTALV